MSVGDAISRGALRAVLLAVGLVNLVVGEPSARADAVVRTNLPGRMLTKEHEVDYLAGGQPPVPAPTNQWLGFGDGLRTRALSRATVRLTDWSQLFLRDHSRLEIIRRPAATNAPSIRLEEGEIYLSSRGGAQAIPVETPHVQGTPKGTEFLVRVTAGATEFTMFDGEVQLTNAFGQVPVPAGWRGIAEPGSPPRLVARIEARNLVQWWIYYPAVVNPGDLALTAGEEVLLADSLAAYRSGHLLEALQRYPGYPAPMDPPSDSQRAYLAALFLAVGAVDQTERMLALSNADRASARALRTMIRAVQPAIAPNDSTGTAAGPESATHDSLTSSELIALSYAHQSTNNLVAALASARAAVDEALPPFGFGWARVAELEFGFGHTRAARRAVQRALELSPKNAQAHCVHGFLLAAAFQLREALAAFDTAIELDPGLANAWLGRGLCQRRLGIFARDPRGDERGATLISRGPASAGWLADLQTAAILEPRRSVVRAYAGKGFGEAGDARLARKEIDYAAQLDARDPTPPLYSALEYYRENRANQAVDELERSIALNDNRAVYRSRVLLDQDHAVRGASLAKIYQAAGLEDVAFREAVRAVSYDYSSHAAHRFLAESFDALRDPARVNLRYETAWYHELLLANLLSPVGAGLLSQNISQQEYSRLFEANRVGLSTSTELRSDGQVRELASQFGILGRTAYALDLDYQHNDGVRPNNDLDRIEWASQIKYQLNDRDSLYLRTEYLDLESGDNFQHYDPANASRNLRVTESQTPLAMLAWHREWGPGNHTTVLGGRLESEQEVSGSGFANILPIDDAGAILSVRPRRFGDLDYESQFCAYVTELNQIFQLDRHTLVGGGRFQWGEFATADGLDHPLSPDGSVSTNLSLLLMTPVQSSLSESFQRLSIYGYENWRPWDNLRLTAGLTYDRLEYPSNFRFPPVSAGQSQQERLSPKVAFQWDVLPNLFCRGIYSRGLGGVSFDESFRLEPAQLAGFSQAFRSVASEAEVGSVAAPRYEIGGLAADVKLRTRTYLGAQANLVQSESNEDLGAFATTPDASFVTTLRERLRYEEKSLRFFVNQLLGDDFAVGANYQVVESRLQWFYPTVPATAVGNPSRTETARLHRVGLQGFYNHRSGFFARAESLWLGQNNEGYPNAVRPAPRPAESTYQVNFALGYRFWRRRGELTVGCLNVTDQDYRLNSLNPYGELPRERVSFVQLKLTL